MEKTLYERSSERHGLAVLNAKEMTFLAAEFTQADKDGQIELEEMNALGYETMGDLIEYTVVPKYRVIHVIDGRPGKFNGMYICEELRGLPHPLLLVPSEKVSKRES